MFVVMGIYALILGAAVGSFLNVVIYRYPREESIVFPASRCPNCGAGIRWYDNVPVLAYIWLGGRCRSCRSTISPLYPLIELANALFYLAIFLRTGVSIGFVPLAIIVSMTIVLIYIDLEIQILPDVIDLPGIAVGLIIGLLQLGLLYRDLTLSVHLLDSLAGAILGGGMLLSVALIYKWFRKVDGMGLGDVKMLAMLGAVVGWRAVFPLLFIASFAGAILGVGLAIRDRQNLQFPIPFGVFLGLATFAVMFFGPTLFAWYRSLLVV